MHKYNRFQFIFQQISLEASQDLQMTVKQKVRPQKSDILSGPISLSFHINL